MNSFCSVRHGSFYSYIVTPDGQEAATAQAMGYELLEICGTEEAAKRSMMSYCEGTQRSSTATNILERALAVMVLDPKIRGWLEQNDPKALLQAIHALQEVKFRFPQPEQAEVCATHHRR